MNQATNNLRGITWMLIHCFLISLMTIIIRKLSDDFHVFQIVFFHNIVAFMLLLPYMLISKQKEIATKKFNLHLLRALIAVISLILYFYAITVIPITQARAIALSGPLVSSVFAIIFFKEKMGKHKITAMVLGLLGAIVILRPGMEEFSYTSLLVVMSVCLWGILDITIKILGRTESSVKNAFYLTSLMSVLSLPLAVLYWKTPQNLEQILWLISVGAIFLINITAIFKAFKYADITVIMPFDFSGMVFVAIMSYLAFGEIIDLWTSIGSAVIVTSTVYMAHREKKARKKHSEEYMTTQEA